MRLSMRSSIRSFWSLRCIARSSRLLGEPSSSRRAVRRMRLARSLPWRTEITPARAPGDSTPGAHVDARGVASVVLRVALIAAGAPSGAGAACGAPAAALATGAKGCGGASLRFAGGTLRLGSRTECRLTAETAETEDERLHTLQPASVRPAPPRAALRSSCLAR